MRSSWIPWVDPKSNDRYPYKKGRKYKEERQRTRPGHVGTEADWTDVAIGRGTPGTTNSWKRPGSLLS